jgi:hypothetical protein
MHFSPSAGGAAKEIMSHVEHFTPMLGLKSFRLLREHFRQAAARVEIQSNTMVIAETEAVSSAHRCTWTSNQKNATEVRHASSSHCLSELLAES